MGRVYWKGHLEGPWKSIYCPKLSRLLLLDYLNSCQQSQHRYQSWVHFLPSSVVNPSLNEISVLALLTREKLFISKYLSTQEWSTVGGRRNDWNQPYDRYLDMKSFCSPYRAASRPHKYLILMTL